MSSKTATQQYQLDTRVYLETLHYFFADYKSETSMECEIQNWLFR